MQLNIMALILGALRRLPRCSGSGKADLHGIQRSTDPVKVQVLCVIAFTQPGLMVNRLAQRPEVKP